MRAHVEGIERAVFGDVTVDDITSCLDRLLTHTSRCISSRSFFAAVAWLPFTACN